ncbi:MAG: flagellin [Oscillospiraceae bacterium]|nr:flagellin [Oscillospiraceae bacterium]MCL2278688.1 flagellin [Oscillospiraceae bacterium]
MRINNNIMAINSHRQYGINAGAIGRNVERLSSGFRVNRAADDAAGLAISEKMRTQIRGLNQASRNSQDGISLVQTAEGAMQSAHAIMQRMRELAVQSANGTNDADDRKALDLEFEQLIQELNQIESTVKFNGMTIFGPGTGEPGGAQTVDGLFTLQSGANAGDITTFTVGNLATFVHSTVYGEMDPAGSEVNDVRIWTVGISTMQGSCNSIAALDNAINSLSMSRAHLGAIQNRLEFKIANLDNTAENLQAAESRIRDVDMARQMTTFTRDNILFQASTAMLAQANQLPQSVLQLLG